MQQCLAILAAIALVTSGCASQGPTIAAPPPRAKPPVDGSQDACERGNGLELVNGLATTGFPAVVQLSVADGAAICTGTFVSDTTLITAAHCLNDNSGGGVTYGSVAPVQVVHHGITGDSASEASYKDQAVVIFPAGTGPAAARLADKTPKAGDVLDIVGYGQTDFINNNAADGTKRQGRNKIVELAEGSTIIVYSAPIAYDGIAAGDQAMSGRGDSGGPLFVGQGLVGTTSQGGVAGGKVEERDVSLFSAEALEMLENAVEAGGKINGLDAARRAILGEDSPFEENSEGASGAGQDDDSRNERDQRGRDGSCS